MNKEIELKEQDDGKIVRCRIKEGGEVVTVRYFRKDMVDSIIEKAKRQVFDDVAKGCRKAKDITQLRVKMFALKEKHLNTQDTEKTEEQDGD